MNATDLSKRVMIAAHGALARKIIGLSGSTAAGQLTFVLAIPILSHLYTPADFGVFTIYLSIVNICGPIVGLKFESGLYAAETREHARLTLALSIVTMAIMTLVVIAFLVLLGDRVLGSFGEATAKIWLLVPFGILMAGMWSSTSAWAIKSDAIPTLAMARFFQPTLMTVLQLIAGFVHLPGIAMVVAHLISHIGYVTYILARSLTVQDWKGFFSLSPSLLLKRAREHVKFPLFVMPAQVGALMVSNLPPVLIGGIFGMDMAGHCGLAYRIIATPLTILSMPLGHVFTNEASRDRSPKHVRAFGQKIFFVSLLLVVIPILLFGSVAPELVGLLLGSRWVPTGQIASALAVFGAAQAITIPFSELTSIYHLQALRFAIELASATLVFTPLVLSAFGGWGMLSTIWTMSIGGAIGSILGFTLVCVALQARFSRTEYLIGSDA